jgi:hypothetical protein
MSTVVETLLLRKALNSDGRWMVCEALIHPLHQSGHEFGPVRPGGEHVVGSGVVLDVDLGSVAEGIVKLVPVVVVIVRHNSVDKQQLNGARDETGYIRRELLTRWILAAEHFLSVSGVGFRILVLPDTSKPLSNVAFPPSRLQVSHGEVPEPKPWILVCIPVDKHRAHDPGILQCYHMGTVNARAEAHKNESPDSLSFEEIKRFARVEHGPVEVASFGSPALTVSEPGKVEPQGHKPGSCEFPRQFNVDATWPDSVIQSDIGEDNGGSVRSLVGAHRFRQDTDKPAMRAEHVHPFDQGTLRARTDAIT